jgi:hypothetical protein
MPGTTCDCNGTWTCSGGSAYCNNCNGQNCCNHVCCQAGEHCSQGKYCL